MYLHKRSVSGTGNRQRDSQGSRAGSRCDWLACRRHWAAGDGGGETPSPAAHFNKNGVDV